MKNIITTLLVLAACTISSAATAATTAQTQTVVPISITVSIDCNGDGIPEDIVLLSGNLYVLMTTASNNTITEVQAQFVPRQVTGTGQITGANYVGTGSSAANTVTFKGAFSGSYISTFVNDFYIIGQDSGLRYLVHDTVHLVVFSNGSVIANVDNAFTTCPGA